MMKPAVQSAREIFVELVNNVPPDQWDRRLAEAAGGDAALRDRVRALLAAHAEPGSFLERPAVAEGEPPFDGEYDLEKPGAVIGRYTLIEPIGEGGFGVVYLAEQTEPIKRQVALKVIKPGMDTKQVIARFEAERQALALMDHPNIAKVLDAGTTGADKGDGGLLCEAPAGPLRQKTPVPFVGGRPYFVMELVKGVPITEYCDRCHLTTRERLQLFVDVCHAVQHAHQKGVIHRDLKPSNVLVVMQDGKPAPKVIDFGVAKAVGQKLTAHTLETGMTQMIGTPAYMSPEQAELSPIDIDTRSDVYSLGALLYELLTGSTPVARERLVRASFDEVRCIIREEEPPRPSARVSTLAADAATTIAGRRRIDSRQLAQQLRGELDWIVLRAMEKDRRRRYESPGAFAADINRYLNNEAVQACPPSKLYGLKKLVSRHRGLFSATAAVVISLLIGLAFATYAFLRAEQESGRSRQIAQVLTEMLESADPSRGNGADYTVREMLDEIAATLDGRIDDDPLVEATIWHIIGRAYFHLGLPNESEPHLRRALELCRDVPAGELDEALILADLGRTLIFTASDLSDAEALVRRAVKIYRERGDALLELANAHCMLGWILFNQTYGLQLSPSENEGVRLSRESLRMLEHANDRRSLIEKGMAFTALACEGQRSPEPLAIYEANDFADRAVELLRVNSPHDHFMGLALKISGLGKIALGRLEEAEAVLREAVAFEQAATGAVTHETLRGLMAAMFQQAKFDEALELARSIRPEPNQQLPPEHVRSQAVIGRFLLGLGDLEGAEAVLESAVEDGKSHLGLRHASTSEARFTLIQALVAQADRAKQDQAQAQIREILPEANPSSDAETYRYAYTFLVAHHSAPAPDDLKTALQVNQSLLAAPYLTPIRLRNLYAGAVLKQRYGDIGGAKEYLQEIIDSPIAYDWSSWQADVPFFVLRNAEDLMARMELNAMGKDAAADVYRSAVTRREAASHQDKHQLALARERLARFLMSQDGGPEQNEAYQNLTAANAELVDAPKCFAWLQQRISEDLNELSRQELHNE